MRKFALAVLSLVLFSSVSFQVYGRSGPRIINEFGDRHAERFDFREHRKRG